MHACGMHTCEMHVCGMHACKRWMSIRDACEGLPGVYSTIWCLCYKTNWLENSGKKWAMG